jgi:hypothetical protein
MSYAAVCAAMAASSALSAAEAQAAPRGGNAVLDCRDDTKTCTVYFSREVSVDVYDQQFRPGTNMIELRARLLPDDAASRVIIDMDSMRAAINTAHANHSCLTDTWANTPGNPTETWGDVGDREYCWNK